MRKSRGYDVAKATQLMRRYSWHDKKKILGVFDIGKYNFFIGRGTIELLLQFDGKILAGLIVFIDKAPDGYAVEF